MLEKIEIKVPIERVEPTLPRYVVVPSKIIAAWELQRTTEVDIEVNGKPGGRRRLRRWDEARWYVQLPEPVCEELGVDTGRVVTIAVRLAVHDLPGELLLVIAEHPDAQARWDNLTAPEQHNLRVQVDAGQLPKTRWERAARALGVEAPVPEGLVKASKNRARQPLRVVLHPTPETPESLAAWDEALDVVADAIADHIIYKSWKEVMIENGRDPSDRDIVPMNLFAEWEAEYDPQSGKSRKKGQKRRDTL